MFCTLPPPIPSSIKSTHSRLNSSNSNNSQQTNQNNQSSTQCYSNFQYSPPDMSSYYSVSAGCFHGTCLVTMANGTKKKTSSIKQGDYVLCPSSTHTITTETNKNNTIIVARVESILRTFSRFGTMNLVSFEKSGLLVTPWHPIKMNGVWTFPSKTIGNKNGNENESKMVCKMTEAVYGFLLGPEIILESDEENNNFGNETLDHLNIINLQQQQDEDEEKVIKRGQSMLINDTECITLAHGIENDKVATHSFYGTEKVVNSMKKRVYSDSKSKLLSLSSQFSLPEYVDLFEGDILKDNGSKLACGFKAIH